MAHPFFDATSYPLHRLEAIALLNALTTAISNVNQISVTYEQCAAGLPPLSLNQAPNLVWVEALKNLSARGLLQKLLDIVGPQFQNSAVMQEKIRDVVNAQGAKEIKITPGNVLVLDRADLRDRLEEMVPDTNPIKVLLVRGGPRSGKSHGRYIFEQFAAEQGSKAVYLYAEIAATVTELINQLFGALEATDKIPPEFTTDKAWYLNACIKLMEAAGKKNQRLWIAIDDLGIGPDGKPLVDGEVNKFCEVFALNMLNPAFRNAFRLMLINYPEGSTPTRWNSEFWTEDRTADSDVKVEHIIELIKAWAIKKDRNIVEDEIKRLAGEVLTKAEAPPPPGEDAKPRLLRIHNELKTTLKDLEKKPV
jgi:hypothetical protein